MIPIRAQRHSKRPPLVVWGIAVACAGVLVRLALLPEDRAAAIVQALGVTPQSLLAFPPSAEALLTLLTAPFMHAGWLHLAGNLLFLLVFGPPVLDRLRSARFISLYIGAGIVGALAHSLAHPMSAAPLVGASGAIAGILGAHLVLEPKSQVTTIVPLLVYFEVARLPAAFVIALWFLLQLASALAPVAASAQSASVAWYAHLGGFAFGMAFAAWTRYASPKRERRPEGRRGTRQSSRRRAA